MNPAALIGLIAVIGFPLGLFWLAKKRTEAICAKLHAVAEAMGLRAIERKVLGFTTIDALEGEQGGRLVRFWQYSTGSGKSRTTWVAVGVRPKQHGGLEFTLSRQGFGSKVSEWFGVKEIQVGDPAFDAAWFILTNQPDYFAAALVPEIRAKFLPGLKDSPSGRYTMADGMVRYSQRGFLDRGEIVQRLNREVPILQDLADVAEVFASTKA